MPHEANPDQDPDQSSNHRLNTSRKYKWLGRAAAVTGALSIPAMAGGFLARNAEAKASSGSVPEMVSGHEAMSPNIFLQKFDNHLNDLKTQLESNPKTIRLTPANLKKFIKDKQMLAVAEQELAAENVGEVLTIYAPSRERHGTLTQLSLKVNKEGRVVSSSIATGFKKKIEGLQDATVNPQTITADYIFSQEGQNGQFKSNSASLEHCVWPQVNKAKDAAGVLKAIEDNIFIIGPVIESPDAKYVYFPQNQRRVIEAYQGYLSAASLVEASAV